MADGSATSIALCLSGGGLRATLFHLGVVKALRPEANDGEDLLSRVSEIYSVSGGSILAAHMLTNWERYTGTPTQFAEVEKEILRFSRRNLRDRILRRWVLLRPLGLIIELIAKLPLTGQMLGACDGIFSRTYWLQQEYEGLTGGLNICQLGPVPNLPGRPRGHFLTTSFTSGELCSFSGTDFEIELRDASARAKCVTTPCGHLRLSFAVAASSAFPPMFPPITLTDKALANPTVEALSKRLCLSDGGVFDNLGVEKFLKNSRRNRFYPPTLIISDAGGSFRSSSEKTFAGVFSRNIRASDILMHRVGDQAKKTISGLRGVNDISIRISTKVDDGTLDTAIQQRLRMVRTDLDRFSPALARLLVDHGERVARHELNKDLPGAVPDASEQVRTDIDKINAISGKAADRSFLSLFVDFRDWTFYPLMLIAMAVLSGSVYYGYSSWTAIEAKKVAERERLMAAEKNALTLSQRTAEQERKLEKAAAALVAKNYSELEQILRDELAVVSRQIKDDEVVLRDAVAAAERTKPDLRRDSAAVAPKSTPTFHSQKVFIQFAGLLKRETIRDLNSRLKAQGWLAQGPSGERLASAGGFNEVRYWGGNGEAATQLRDEINASGLAPNPIELRNMGSTGSSNLEVWISR